MNVDFEFQFYEDQKGRKIGNCVQYNVLQCRTLQWIYIAIYPVLYQFCDHSISWLSCTPIWFR